MRYSIEIKKFLYSQYFFGGLRTVLGIALPAVFFTLVFHNQEIGFTLATGAIGASVVDLPGPLKYKHNEMLACSLLGFLAALATGIATTSPLALWLTIVPLTFVVSLTVVYGNKWPQISFATLFMMIVTVDQHLSPLEALINASWLLLGGLWYTYWSYFVNRWQAHRLERQALSESIFATAAYLRSRAAFFDEESDLDEDYRQLVAAQIAAVERQDAARDIVLRNLPQLRRGALDAQRARLFNLFINTVDLHENIVAAHTDYALVRSALGKSDILTFFGDLIRKLAADLEDVGLALLQNTAVSVRLRAKPEPRAIEYEIEQMRKKGVPERHPEAYAALVATYRRVWSLSRQIEKIHRNMNGTGPETELRVDQALSRFLSRRPFIFKQIFSNLTLASPGFRHALRVTLAVALGLTIGEWLPLTNAYWIVLTSVVILKPGFSLTRQRNIERIVGTVIGCAASVVLILLIKEPAILLIAMFGCMLMAYSLLLFNYGAAAVFMSAYILLLYHLLAPSNMRLIGERAIDTVIGGAIALAISYLFPYWEHRLMRPLVKGVLESMRKYLHAVRQFASKPLPVSVSAPAMAGVASMASAGSAAMRGVAEVMPAGSTATLSATLDANAIALSDDLGYRLSRKNTHVAFANLGQAFQRMMREPKSQQRFVAEINDLLVQSHALASQITAAGPLMAALSGPEPEPLIAAIAEIDANLACAAAGSGPDAGQPERLRTLLRDLDAMVVKAESVPDPLAPEPSPETAQELKLLAHQCKQMLAASSRIRKDAEAIRLPD